MSTIGSNFWIWGHPINSCQQAVGTTEEMSVTPAESARYFGVSNVYYVPWGHDMDMTVYSKDTEAIAKTGLSVERWGKEGGIPLEETFKLVPLLPNINRLVFDDFFCGIMKHIPTYGDTTVAELTELRDKIHAAGLEMWAVLYQHQLDLDIREHLQVFDGISFWFWSEPTIEQYHKYTQVFIDMTPNKRRLIGCYLFNFNYARQASPEMVRYQLDHNREMMKQGILEGVVLHNNNFGKLNFPAYEEAKKWMDEHGAEEI